MINISVPTSYTSSSIISTQKSRKIVNKGVGRDQIMKHLLENVAFVHDENNGSSASDIIGWAMECQRMTEESDKESMLCIFLSVASGMLSSVHDSILPTKQQKSTTTSRINKYHHNRTSWYIKPPIIQPMMKSSEEIKAATNFCSELEMMACIIIVCNGDWNVMTESVTVIMTWYKEWYFVFEYIWGDHFQHGQLLPEKEHME